MIPQYEVDILQDCDTKDLRLPEEGLMKHESGLLANRVYEDMRGISWDESKEALKAEIQIIKEADSSSSDEDEFDGQVDQLIDKYEKINVFMGFDVGVAAATMVLSSIGGAPVSSCRGHSHQKDTHPYVGGWINRIQAERLLKICKGTDIGISNYIWEQNMGIMVYANNVQNMLKFADIVIKNSNLFATDY